MKCIRGCVLVRPLPPHQEKAHVVSLAVFKILLKRVFRFSHKTDCLGFFRASEAMLAWIAVPNAHLSKCLLQFVSGTGPLFVCLLLNIMLLLP